MGTIRRITAFQARVHFTLSHESIDGGEWYSHYSIARIMFDQPSNNTYDRVKMALDALVQRGYAERSGLVYRAK